jgi:hypothetical protein
MAIESVGRQLLLGLARFGVLGLAIAVIQLILLRGLDPRIFILFGLPPVFAAIFASKSPDRITRCLAWGFLGALGAGVIIAHLPWLFPRPGGWARGWIRSRIGR